MFIFLFLCVVAADDFQMTDDSDFNLNKDQYLNNIDKPFILEDSIQYIPLQQKNEIVIAFGSCADFRIDTNSTIFYKIAQKQPDLFIWSGDVAYVSKHENQKIDLDSTNFHDFEKYVHQAYDSTQNHVSYQYFKSQNIPIIGTWDDHDYGPNDGDQNYIHKDKMQQIFLDFIGEPKKSARRFQKGVYQSYFLGDRVKIILLDVRYHKQSWIRGMIDSSLDLLGSDQYQWYINSKYQFISKNYNQKLSFINQFFNQSSYITFQS